jgi:hypothetical protein
MAYEIPKRIQNYKNPTIGFWICQFLDESVLSEEANILLMLFLLFLKTKKLYLQLKAQF